MESAWVKDIEESKKKIETFVEKCERCRKEVNICYEWSHSAGKIRTLAVCGHTLLIFSEKVIESLVGLSYGADSKCAGKL